MDPPDLALEEFDGIGRQTKPESANDASVADLDALPDAPRGQWIQVVRSGQYYRHQRRPSSAGRRIAVRFINFCQIR